jgi:hypothetical protein
MPGIVDPRPHREAELNAKKAELAMTDDEPTRAKLIEEIKQLEHDLGRGGLFRKLLLGFGHRSSPW